MRARLPVAVFAIAALVVIGCSAGVQFAREQTKHPGQLVFNGHVKPEVNCWKCHNGDGRGSGKGPDLAPKVAKLDNAAILEAIDTGTFAMPGFGEFIKRDEQTQILDWLRSVFGSPATHRTPAVETEAIEE